MASQECKGTDLSAYIKKMLLTENEYPDLALHHPGAGGQVINQSL